jgi:hypothetical protein
MVTARLSRSHAEGSWPTIPLQISGGPQGLEPLTSALQRPLD